MLNTKLHTTTKPTSVRNSTFYKKALGLYELSRKLKEHTPYFSAHPKESRAYSLSLTEDVLVLAIRLPYTIALAQTTPNYQNRLRALQTLSVSIAHLKQRCKQIDTLSTSQYTHLQKLRQELQIFSNLFKSWEIVLTRQN